MVEDLTGKGLDDMKQGIARTPLEPKKTFVDDPLRVLRSIRFAQRFGLAYEENIFLAAQDPQVRESFESKISYERIMMEMDKMFAN